MNCERYEAALSDYADGTLQASDQPQDGVDVDALEAHLADCPRCRAIVEDLHVIGEAARGLERRMPPPEVWARIAAAIEAAPVRPAASLFMRRDLWAAAALVVLLIGGSWFAWRQLTPPPAPALNAVRATAPAGEPDPELVQDVETELTLAEEHYVKAIAGLEAITAADGAELDEQTAGVLQANLTVIDGAIGESRAALLSEPSSDVAQHSLFEALRTKVALLQSTIALINEMRQGNQEGAARIVSGLNP